MLSNHVSRVALVALALVLGVATAAPASSLVDTAPDPSGKYRTADGYVVFAVDDAGRVQGFFEKAGMFGQLSGTLVNGAIEGRWHAESGIQTCESAYQGAKSWGAFQFRVDDQGTLQGSMGQCEQKPVERWDGCL